MTTAAVLRPATASDRRMVTALLDGCGLPTADIAAGLAVAVRGEDLDGVVGVESYGECALLRSLAVAPGCRSRGLGERLVDLAVAMARRGGARELYLLTTTAADYFARLGFERIDRAAAPAAILATTEFAHLCPESAACMRRRISEEAR